MSSRVLVVAEMEHLGLTRSTREVMTAGRKLADGLNGELAMLVLTGDRRPHADQCFAGGADSVYSLDDPKLALYQAEVFLNLLERICRLLEPSVVLMCHSWLGCDLAPRLAYRLGSLWGAGCVDLRVDVETNSIVQTRLLRGGQVLVDEIHEALPAVITIRARSFDPVRLVGPGGDHSETLTLPLDSDQRVRTLELQERTGGVAGSLREAEVVVTGGRGMGSAQAFATLEEMASVLGGTVGASKGAVDADWVPAERQIGLSGMTVAPRLYFAVGVSGAYQHMAGCNKSKVIVAINKDAEAPIFRYARFGVIDEWQNLLPSLIDALKSEVVR